MPNHVHLLAVPETQEGFARGIGEAHRRYTRRINFREGWRGHLWQERFASFPMDETYLLAAVKYVEMNPVTSGLVGKPQDYFWSSARAHIEGENDILVRVSPLLEMVGNWEALPGHPDKPEIQYLQRHEKTGRPLGADKFFNHLENQLNRPLSPKKPGPRRKAEEN